MLIVTTASREWPASAMPVIDEALATCMNAAWERGETLQIRVGDARGGDRRIYAWADTGNRRKWAVDKPQRYEAKWRAPCIEGRCKPGHRREDSRGSVCPLQGYVRNELMCDERPMPTLCLAFIYQKSRGATHCADYAASVGIEVQPFRL